MNKPCAFSPCRKYRYTLWREWGNINPIRDLLCSFERQRDGVRHLGNRDRFLQIIGLNPSTADDTQDDPTIRRCIQFAKDWGFGGLCMTNLFAFRATDPKDMKQQADPVGRDNDYWLMEIAEKAGLILCAWGKDGKFLYRGEDVKRSFGRRHQIALHCLGLNGDRTPKHPLYLKKDLRPISFT